MKAIFHKKIPIELVDDFHYLNDVGERTGREHAIVFGKKSNKSEFFTCNDSRGNASMTDAPPCDTIHGKTIRMGDAHNHPVGEKTVGIVPSGSDIYTTLEDSANERRPQISCITNHQTPLIGCYQNKRLPTKQKLQAYRQAIIDQMYSDNGYLIDNFAKDFITSFYEPQSGKQIYRPEPREIVDAAFGGATDTLRDQIKDFEKSGFCQFIQSMTIPKDSRVSSECRRRLAKERSIWDLV